MSSIEIIKLPPGDPPEEIRKAWIGCRITLTEQPKQPIKQRGVLGGKAQNEGGYHVSGWAAMQVLKRRNEAAAAWWYRNVPNIEHTELIFAKDVCEYKP